MINPFGELERRLDQVDGFEVIESTPNRLVISTTNAVQMPIAVTVQLYDGARAGVAVPLIPDAGAGRNRERFLEEVHVYNGQRHNDAVVLNETRSHWVLKRDMQIGGTSIDQAATIAAQTVGQVVVDQPSVLTEVLRIAKSTKYRMDNPLI